jgi:hypothetical protein
MTTQLTSTRPIRVFGISAIVSAAYFVAILYAASAPYPLTAFPSSVETVAVYLLAVVACGLLKYIALRSIERSASGNWPSIVVNAIGAPMAGATLALFYWSILLRQYP